MLIPLVILAVFSIACRLCADGLTSSLRPRPPHHGHQSGDCDSGHAGRPVGIGLAWFLYAARCGARPALCEAWVQLYGIVKQKFYIDEVYLFITKKLIFDFVARPIAWFDRHVVDGGVNLSGWMTRTTGGGLQHLQTGQVQTYGVWFVAGTMFVLLILWAWWI